MGGEQSYGVAADALLGQRAAGQVLRLELVEQGDHALAAVGAAGRLEQLGPAALDLRDVVEQRDDGVEVAVGRPGGRTQAARGRLELVAASGSAPTAPTAPPPGRRRRAARGPRSAAGTSRAAGRAMPLSRVISSRGSATASRSSSADGLASRVGPSGWVCRSSSRSSRPSRRSADGSAPPSGESSSWRAVSAVRTVGSATTRSAISSGATAGSCAIGSSSPATSRGTPEALRTLRSKGMLRAPDRTSTAIRDHGGAELEVLAAEQLGDRLGLGARPTGGCAPRRRRPASTARAGGRGGPSGPGRRQARRRDGLGDPPRGLEQGAAGPPADGERLHRGLVSGCRAEALRELEQPAHLRAAEAVDRLVGVADDDQVAAVAGERLQQPLLRRVGVLVLVDEDRAVAARAARSRTVRLLGEQDRAVDQLGVVEGALRVEDVEVLAEEAGQRGPVRRGPPGRPARRAGRGRARPRGPGSAAP